MDFYLTTVASYLLSSQSLPKDGFELHNILLLQGQEIHACSKHIQFNHLVTLSLVVYAANRYCPYNVECNVLNISQKIKGKFVTATERE
jgi:hypothetical protein